MPPVAIGANVVTGTGTCSPNLRLRGDALGRAQLRVGQRPRVRVVLEQPVVDAGHARQAATSDAVRLRRSCERQAGAVDVGRCRRCRSEPGRRELQAVLPQARAIDLEQLDVDDHLGPRLVDRGDQPRRRGDPLGRVLDRDRVGRGDRRDLPDVDDDAEQVDDFLDVGVAQVERADDRLFVLAALGRRVGDDRDRARRGDAVERARAAVTDASASASVALRRSTVIGASRKAGSKTRLRPAKRRERREDHAAARAAEDQRVGQLDVVRADRGRAAAGRECDR